MSHFNYHQRTLFAENVSLLEIAKAVGTPAYIYSQTALVEAWQAFANAMQSHPHKICYAVKANSNLAVLHCLARLGSGFDIVSAGELARVIAAGGRAEQVVFSGVGKTQEEIITALKLGIFCFNVESESELFLLNHLAQHLNVRAPLALRVNPDVDAKSHPYISTGLKENKFGVPIEQALPLYQQAAVLPHLAIKGIASHIGSQLTDLKPFTEALKRLLEVIQHLAAVNISLSHIDVGGGLGVRYQNELVPSPENYAKALLQLPVPAELTILLEPGRAICAKAGILLTKVLRLKKSGTKNFCIVDCAMNDLIRPTLYQAWQNIIPLIQREGTTLRYDVAGPVCESGDFLGKDRDLNVQAEDYLAICDSGAYGFTMSSNYNTRPRCAEVMVKNAQYKIVRERETIEELFAKECLW